jgi:alpha-L-fucosidase
MKSTFFCSLLVGFLFGARAQAVKASGPLPTPSQLEWSDLEFYLFVHFGPNTFTDLEWGKGTEREETFHPAALDCRQWCRVAKAAGARGIIITAKHHDGFCLWPSAYSRHTVRESHCMNGKGDVLKSLSDACRAYGLRIGVYLSPWDRNHPAYGTPAYNEVFEHMMKEVVARYGPLFEFWWDGANGEGPNGKKQDYDWHGFEQTLRTVAPGTVVFSDIGPDIRWVGNEEGRAGDPNWARLDTAGFTRGAGAPPTDTLNRGNLEGKNWIPAECDVSIRPGWFYHAKENGEVKSPQTLFGLYLRSVGRGANLLLNVPPDTLGLISPFDSAALVGFRMLRDRNFSRSLLDEKKGKVSTAEPVSALALLTDKNNRTYISLGNHYAANFIEIKFPEPVAVNCLVLQEPIQMGQRIESFRVEIKEGDKSYNIPGQTIGHKRIISFPVQRGDRIRIYVTGAKAVPLLSELDAFLIDESLIESGAK